MLTTAQRNFCEGVVSGLTPAEAWKKAHPRVKSAAAARAAAKRALGDAEVCAEIQRLRDLAASQAGGAVLTLVEKRKFLARLVRAQIASLPEDSDLFVSITRGRKGTEYRLGDKLAAIKLDNNLAGDGSEAEKEDALGGLLRRVMGEGG